MGRKRKKNKNKSGYRPSSTIQDPEFIIYTDGGCSFNPGGIGGYGVVIIPRDNMDSYELSGAYAPTSNNRMELMAAIKALESLPDGWKTARIFSDSQYFTLTADGQWHGRKNHDLWKCYWNLVRDKSVEYQWVRGHHGDVYNERCDELATIAMNSIPPEPDIGYDVADFYHAKTSDGVRLEKGAMYKQITVPEKYADVCRFQNIEEFKDNGVHDGCAEGMDALLRATNPSFKQYADIKTGGIDFWSRKSKEFLEEQFEKDIWSILMENLDDNEADCLAAFRWYGRGLPLDMAIRKILVSNEISRNAVNIKRRRNK